MLTFVTWLRWRRVLMFRNIHTASLIKKKKYVPNMFFSQLIIKIIAVAAILLYRIKIKKER